MRVTLNERTPDIGGGADHLNSVKALQNLFPDNPQLHFCIERLTGRNKYLSLVTVIAK